MKSVYLRETINAIQKALPDDRDWDEVKGLVASELTDLAEEIDTLQDGRATSGVGK